MTTSPKLQEHRASNPKFDIKDAVDVAIESQTIAPTDLNTVLELAFDKLQETIDAINDEAGLSGQDIIDDLEIVQMAIGEFAVLK